MLEAVEDPAGETAGDAPYLTRELTWLQFHERVLGQSRPGAHPLLERLRFVAISDTILDEFLSIHVSGLMGRVEAGDAELTPDGCTQAEQLDRIRRRLGPVMVEQRRAFNEGLVDELAAAGIYFRRWADLAADQQAALREQFLAEVFPVCTPLAVDPAHPFPFISGMSLNLAVVLWDRRDGQSFARIKVPTVLPRLLRVPGDAATAFVWLEEIMANNLDAFFPGVEVREVCLFRVVRDADIELQELEATDLRESVAAGVRRRRFGETVCVQLETAMPDAVQRELITRLDVYPEDVYVIGGPLGLRDLMPVADLNRPDLKDPPLVPRLPSQLAATNDMFTQIRERDLLLHHPFDSFKPVLDFITQAARDPQVLAIKQTLYRVGQTSPIVQALIEAAERGKQVAVVVELKARGDEENNLEWAEALERTGAHLSYGIIGLKTHAKMALVVRREAEGLRRYVHLGTGNYNTTPYTDLSLFTCRPAVGEDASEIFNLLTGRSRQESYDTLLVSPVTVRRGLLERIEREIAHHERAGGGHLIFKTNSFVDLEFVDAVYRASRAGVRVDLIVRGMCCVLPGVPGVSENVRVISIVGRFLEHSRVYYFANGGASEIFIGSADLMERNLNRRVETLVPVQDAHLARALKERLLDLQLADTVRAAELRADGRYHAIDPGDGPPIDAQQIWATTTLSLMDPGGK